jgi:hypothetical protein
VVCRAGGVGTRHQHPGVPRTGGRCSIPELGDLRSDLQGVRLAADVRGQGTEVGSSDVEANRLPEPLRRELLYYLSVSSEQRARLIGELTRRNPGMANLLVDLEANDDLRTRFEIDLLRSVESMPDPSIYRQTMTKSTIRRITPLERFAPGVSDLREA